MTFSVCVYIDLCRYQGVQRTTCKSWFSPSTVCVPGIEVRSVGLTASAFTHGAILPTPSLWWLKQEIPVWSRLRWHSWFTLGWPWLCKPYCAPSLTDTFCLSLPCWDHRRVRPCLPYKDVLYFRFFSSWISTLLTIKLVAEQWILDIEKACKCLLWLYL